MYSPLPKPPYLAAEALPGRKARPRAKPELAVRKEERVMTSSAELDAAEREEEEGEVIKVGVKAEVVPSTVRRARWHFIIRERSADDFCGDLL